MNILGQRIKLLRQKNSLTQDSLAKVIGISRGSLSMIEIDKREPDNETLNKIANYFNVTTDYLLGRTDESNPRNNHYDENSFSNLKVKEDNVPFITDHDLEELMKKSGIMFDGIPLDEDDKDDIMRGMRMAWEIIQKRKKQQS